MTCIHRAKNHAYRLKITLLHHLQLNEDSPTFTSLEVKENINYNHYYTRGCQCNKNTDLFQ